MGFDDFSEDEKAEHYDALLSWQQQVDRFGGRVGQAGMLENRMAELQASQLGGSYRLPWAAGGSFTPRVVGLCEMRLSTPIDVEVVVSLPNNLPTFVNVSDPESPTNLQRDPTLVIGSGRSYLRITWGSQQGSQNVVEADCGKGWRYPFRASYLRVDWVLQNSVFTTDETYERDFLVTAQIVPTLGGVQQPLYKTEYYNQNDRVTMPAGIVTRVVPAFARWCYLSLKSPVIAFPNFTGRFLDGVGDLVAEIRNPSGAGTYPTYVPGSIGWPVPQEAQTLEINNASGGDLVNPSAQYLLSI